MGAVRRIRFTDTGQAWVPWDIARAFEDDRLARAVSEFEPVPNPAGWAAAQWLREDSLAYHGFAVTYLALVNLNVKGFYAMCAGEIEVREKERRELALPTNRLPVAQLVWLARSADGELSGLELLAHAQKRAELVAQVQGLAGLAVDPFDEVTADIWQSPPYDFMPTETGRLWSPLPGRASNHSMTVTLDDYRRGQQDE